jgi:Phage protein (N4 Gp49/phage Sf6 gene 66) family
MTEYEYELEQRIQELRLTHPRVTPETVDSKIIKATFTTLPSNKVMVCEITLRNGFTVRGESCTVSPENFNVELGREISYRNAREKVWELEGYLLQESLYAQAIS